MESNGRATRLGKQFSPYEASTLPTASAIEDDVVVPLTAPPSFIAAEFIARLGEQDYEAGLDNSDLSDLSDLSDSSLSDMDIESDAKSDGSLSDMDVESDDENGGRTLPMTHNQRSREKKKEKRRIKRTAAQATANTSAKGVVQRRQQEAMANTLDARIRISDSFNDVLTDPVWIAKRDVGEDLEKGIEARDYELDELLGEFQMREIDWDGRTTRPLKDRNNVLCGVLGGEPRDNGCNDWDKVQAEATRDIAAAGALLYYDNKHVDHHRGPFPAVAMGISFGGGQTRPSLLYQMPHNRPIVNALLQSPGLSRIAGFGNCLFRSYAPRLHGYYSGVLDALERDDRRLIRPMPGSAFAACTVNFGPRTVTYPHRDTGNLTWGWCAITALGNFDSKRGGHLVLWDFNCVIRFPSGSTILLPSALVRHSNVPISPGETRYSFAQYSAGGLFRWVKAGFQSEEQRIKDAPHMDSNQRKIFLKEQRAQRWAMGLGMLSTVEEFL